MTLTIYTDGACEPNPGKGETWRQLRDTRYHVSDLGRVRGVGAKILTPCVDRTTGYVVYGIHHEGTQKSVRGHVAVLETFVGPRPLGMEALHGDGDRTNNRLANLRWGTPAENALDRFLHGTVRRGADLHKKLSDDDVRYILRNYRPRCGVNGNKAMSRRFGISDVMVTNIVTGRQWRHIFDVHHAGILGNERADELSQVGREQAIEANAVPNLIAEQLRYEVA